MAVRSSSNRYQNYGRYSSVDHSRTTSNLREDSPRHSNLVATSSSSCSTLPSAVQSSVNGHEYYHHHHHHQGQAEEERPSTSSRLEYIINSMAYIREELDDLKESDRALLDIFKQLENNVSELSDSLSTWRATGSSSGRLSSITDLDFGNSRLSYCEDTPRGLNGGLETILDSSKEDLYKASTDLEQEKDAYKTSAESDSLYLPEHDTSSNSCSPVLTSLKSHPSVPSINSSSGASKRSADPSPQLRTSTSYTSRLAHSPSITRLQDETGSNSSIDSGIQFASEAENGSGNGVEPMQVPAAEPEVDTNDVRKSVGFADDIFSALGLK